MEKAFNFFVLSLLIASAYSNATKAELAYYFIPTITENNFTDKIINNSSIMGIQGKNKVFDRKDWEFLRNYLTSFYKENYNVLSHSEIDPVFKDYYIQCLSKKMEKSIKEKCRSRSCVNHILTKSFEANKFFNACFLLTQKQQKFR